MNFSMMVKVMARLGKMDGCSVVVIGVFVGIWIVGATSVAIHACVEAVISFSNVPFVTEVALYSVNDVGGFAAASFSCYMCLGVDSKFVFLNELMAAFAVFHKTFCDFFAIVLFFSRSYEAVTDVGKATKSY